MACSYDSDSEYWDAYLDTRGNQQYRELYEVATMDYRKIILDADNLTPSMSGTSVSTLIMDTVDLSQLFEDLYRATNRTAFIKQTKANPEKLDRCNFGFKSKMIRALRPASSIYRALSLNMQQQTSAGHER